MNPKSCKTCQFSTPSPQPDRLLCKFNPPSVSIVPVPRQNALGQVSMDMQVIAAFPPVQLTEFCFKWEASGKGLVLS